MTVGHMWCACDHRIYMVHGCNICARGLKHGLWSYTLLHMTPSWSAGVTQLERFNELTTFLPSLWSYAPYAQVPRRLGAGALNRSTVCTVGAVAPGAGFLRLNERVSQVHSRRVRIVEPETTSLKRETSRRPNFFIFRPIEVPKEPRQGFWDAGKPLEQSVCQFEHCKTCF
jgi:hypothetical protein